MPEPTAGIELPARTHEQAHALLRRPFAPGAVGFRAMHKVAYQGDPSGGAQVAAYISAQSVIQRLNLVVPGRWRQDFHIIETPESARKLYLACRLTITLPLEESGPDVDAVYEDIGDMDIGSLAGVKALYSDARKRAGAVAGIGTYLYTALEQVTLPIGSGDRHVIAIHRPNKSDLLIISSTTEQWLRGGYAQRIASDAVKRDIGEILSHGEPETGMGQGETTELSDTEPAHGPTEAAAAAAPAEQASGANGVVSVDFGRLGPQAA